VPERSRTREPVDSLRFVTDDAEVSALLTRAERAVFHGAPAEAVALIEPALDRAQQLGASLETGAARWLLGVALAAAGRYGGALTVLAPLVEAGQDDLGPPGDRLFAALAAASVASVHRQLGRHAVARECDLQALELSDGAGEAAFDAELGLASDAVGLDDAAAAARHLAAAAALVEDAPDDWWRQRVRLAWTRAEVLLLDGQLDDAVDVALGAVREAQAADAPRHVAKGLLIAGLAQVSGGQPSPDAWPDGLPAGAGEDVEATLFAAASRAEQLGAVPLVWAARALLGALTGERDFAQGQAHLSAARAAVRQIAADLPPGVRAGWLARADVAALLGEQADAAAE